MIKQKDLGLRKWNSLNDVKAHIEQLGQEQILHFNGHTLLTDQHRYTLAFGQLDIEKIEHTRPDPAK